MLPGEKVLMSGEAVSLHIAALEREGVVAVVVALGEEEEGEEEALCRHLLPGNQ